MATLSLDEANAIINGLSDQALAVVGMPPDGGVAHARVYAQLLARLPIETQHAISKAYAEHNAAVRNRMRRR